MLLDAQVELTPVVTSVSPASGSTAGGQTVTITGKYLDSAVNVVFGSHPATTFSVDLSGEHITATTPASGAGPSTSTSATSTPRAKPSPPTGTPSWRRSRAGRAPPPPGGRGSGPGRPLVVTGFQESAEQMAPGLGAAAHQQRARRHDLRLHAQCGRQLVAHLHACPAGPARHGELRRAQPAQQRQAPLQALRAGRQPRRPGSRRPRQGRLPGPPLAHDEADARQLHRDRRRPATATGPKPWRAR